MVYDRFRGSLGKPGSGPGREAFDIVFGETAETVAKEAIENKAVFTRKHRPAFRLNRQPNRESVRQTFQRWG